MKHSRQKHLAAAFAVLLSAVLLLLAGGLLVGCADEKGNGSDWGESDGIESTEASSSEESAAPAESAVGSESSPSETASSGEPEKVYRVILLAGQSNAVGHSVTSYLPDKAGLISPERTKEISKGYRNIRIMYSINPYQSNARSNKLYASVNFGEGLSSYHFGPEVGMAEYLNNTYPGEEFYIIKCATGATSLMTVWNPENSGQEKNLYDEMTAFTEQALSKLTEEGGRAEIVAFCWMQGEADSGKVSSAEYNRVFDILINSFSEKFKDFLSPEGMAVIQAGITKKWSGYFRINAAKEQWAKEGENRYYFSTMDLTYNLDNTDYSHYDAAAMILLGNRFGECVGKHVFGETGE